LDIKEKSKLDEIVTQKKYRSERIRPWGFAPLLKFLAEFTLSETNVRGTLDALSCYLKLPNFNQFIGVNEKC